MREEIIQIHNGTGRIKLHISDGLSLRFDDQPVIFNWYDCRGSIGQYLIRGVPVEDYQSILDTVRNLVSGQDTNLSLAESLQGLLQMFESGQYCLQETIINDYKVIEFSKTQDIKTYHSAFYPFNGVLICTQPQEYLCTERVNHYKSQILLGQLPLLITTGLYRKHNILFVLDGHHKLQAYQELNINPRLVAILSVTTPFITYSEDGIFGCAQALRSHHAKIKAKYNSQNENHMAGPDRELPLPIGLSAELFKAIETQDLDKVIYFLKQAPNLVATINENGQTPLMMACDDSDMSLAIIQELLKYPQHWNIEDVDGELALHYTVWSQRLDIMAALLDAGYPIELESSQYQTALVWAARLGLLNALKYLVSRGALVNPKNENPLIYAIIHNHKATVCYLLQQGADPYHNPICHYWPKKPFSILDEGWLQDRYWKIIKEAQEENNANLIK